jgi:serine/threonine protein kinase
VSRPAILDRFLREIRSAARLHHPNIVTAYAALRLGESLLLAMEYVDGLDLARIVKANGPLPVAHACNYIHQAALGLQHAHEHGMVHRDIKPANLILARAGGRDQRAVVKVLDFGLAKVTLEGQRDSELTREGQMLGTPDYIAPEQIRDAQSADTRADIYSLGCTLYYLLTAKAPFKGANLWDIYQAHLSMDAAPLNLARPEVPVELAALVAKMMAKEPGRRFREPKEVAHALKQFFKPGNPTSIESKPEISQAPPPESPPQRADADAGLAWPADRTSLLPSERSGPVQPTSIPEGPIDPHEKVSLQNVPGDVPPRTAVAKKEVYREPRAGSKMTAIRSGLRPRAWWAAAGTVGLGLLLVWGSGILKVKTGDGVIVVKDLPRDADVFVDDERITLEWPGAGEAIEIRAVPGRRKVEVKKGSWTTFGETITVKAGEKAKVTVRLEPLDFRRASGRADQLGRTSDTGSPPDARIQGQLSTAQAPPLDEARRSSTDGPVGVGDRSLGNGAESDESQASVDSAGFVPLFNGRDLEGWEVDPENPGNWRVVDGVLVGSGAKLSHLYTKRNDFLDFQLHVSARINREGNSGIIFRTAKPTGNPASFLKGYEAEIRVRTGSPSPSGSLMHNFDPIGRVTTSPVAADRWFDMDITAVENRFIVTVDGKTLVDQADRKRRVSPGGRIALQDFRNPVQTTIEFRKIEIKRLVSTRSVRPEAIPEPGSIPATVERRGKARGPETVPRTFEKQGEQKPSKPPARSTRTDGFVSLLNGMDLEGWEYSGPKHSGQWSVLDGRLEGRGVGGTATLATKRQDFRDYQLRVVYSSPKSGYGRIELRRSGNEKSTSGYWVSLGIRPHRDQADWPAGNICKIRKYAYGFAFPIGRRSLDAHAAANTRHTLEIEVLGDRIISSFDGNKSDDYADVTEVYRSGGIALNCSDASIITIEELSIREFRSPGNGPEASEPTTP